MISVPATDVENACVCAQIEGRAAEMRETLLKVMSAQWGEDAKVKFS